ncbi:MAG TPA: chemotaxis protein CheC, partial [Elusimicrobiales bacterium]|nr:chemotaxis protein CheC [Elusimicrobiales bacterium]
GRAATSLSELIGSNVNITVPDTRIYPYQQLSDTLRGPNSKYYSFSTEVHGDLQGKNLLLLAEPDMKVISSLLLGQEQDKIQLDDPMVISSLKEVANILLSSYMNALSELTDFKILVGVPEFAPAKTTEEILAEQVQSAEDVLYVRSYLEAKNTNFNGVTIFVPNLISLDKIFSKLGL